MKHYFDELLGIDFVIEESELLDGMTADEYYLQQAEEHYAEQVVVEE